MKGPDRASWEPSEEYFPEAAEALYAILVPENKGRAIQLKDFSDLYGEKAIEKNEAYVRFVESKIASYGKQESAMQKFADLFEALVNSQIEESNWMGENANVIVPSRFDDIVGGVDSIVEFEEETSVSHLALAIDATESDMKLSEKFEKIKKSIDDGELSYIKYFRSGNFRGELSQVPRVVVGADRSTIKEIEELLLRFKRMQKTVSDNRKQNDQSEMARRLPAELVKIRNEIAAHPLQKIMLIEIQTQLKAFGKYAEAIGAPASISQTYYKMLAIIDKILEEKEDVATKEDALLAKIVEKSETFGR